MAFTGTPLLLTVEQFGELIGVKRRKAYDLVTTNEEFRRAVVEIPGLRGKRIRFDLVRRAIEGLTLTELEK